MAAVKVLAVPEGSIVALTGVTFGEQLPNVIESMRKAIGHDRWVLLTLDDGAAAELWGPDDLTRRLRAALRRRNVKLEEPPPR